LNFWHVPWRRWESPILTFFLLLPDKYYNFNTATKYNSSGNMEINLNLKAFAFTYWESNKYFAKRIFCQFQSIPPHLEFILNMSGVFDLVLYQFGSFGIASRPYHSWIRKFRMGFSPVVFFAFFSLILVKKNFDDLHVHFVTIRARMSCNRSYAQNWHNFIT